MKYPQINKYYVWNKMKEYNINITIIADCTDSSIKEIEAFFNR